MVQIRSNNNLVEDLAIGQTLEKNKKSVKSSFYKMISKASQSSIGSDTLFENGYVQWLSAQKVSKNLGIIDTKNLMKLNTPSGNKESSKEE